MNTRTRAAKIVEQIQPVLDKFNLTALVLYDEDDAVSDENDNPLVPPARKPRSKKMSKEKRKNPRK